MVLANKTDGEFKKIKYNFGEVKKYCSTIKNKHDKFTGEYMKMSKDCIQIIVYQVEQTVLEKKTEVDKDYSLKVRTV